MDFSIIVPVYNRGSIVMETLPYILNQNYDNYEVIVVDDGSTDDSLLLLQSVSHPRLKVLHKTNGERAAARNYGAMHASGTYVNFFDCDDWMYPNHLSEAMQVIQKNGSPELLHVCYEFKNTEGKVTEKVSVPPEGTVKHLIKNNFLACNTVFVKRETFLKHRFNENRALSTGEDWEIWLRLVSRYGIVGSNTITFAIQEHEGRSLNTISSERIEARNLAMNEALLADEAFVSFYKKEVNFFIAQSLSFIALSYANNFKTKGKALKYLKQAFIVYPPIILLSKRFLATAKNILTRFGS
ncbi:glycosyltransferase family 2 protein [Taibaiella soli]|uniref:Glycosyltransferase 2-like domain-containing protein n=1 Tax=Taibaiella soli TaxID=1649169 RepID=A0A2W2BEM4_9BACT|nr:glycosyltransferase family A protein [Taibaiella soli]PZF72036.1 hypothetical protein DN068_15485 [Taibaiella soli]